MGSILLLTVAAVTASPPGDREFFESHIRPLLVERCYRCHNSAKTRRGRLALDWRGGLLEGGRRGPAIVPGDPDRSLLLRVLRHEEGLPRMPRGEPKLEPEELDLVAEWIRRGAPDPRTTPPTEEELARETSWEAVRERRKDWWSFRPLNPPLAPRVEHALPGALRDPADAFLGDELEKRGLEPAPEARRSILFRRAALVLTGLPPAREDAARTAADPRPDAYEREVDRLLATPRFGERWARHWMDLVRYAESHGSEGDPAIPYAYRYRDALIRAFNRDVPLDRLILEHLAGDFVEPRVDEATGINDAAVLLGHFRFVQHGYAPTDALDEQVRFTENQIDVVSKAFLGLTVACARCHDHKFDPISQRDFYALYGIFLSSRPGTITADAPARRDLHKERLRELKTEIREVLARAWLREAESLPGRLLALRGNAEAAGNDKPLARALEEAAKAGPLDPLHTWTALSAAAGSSASAEAEAHTTRLEGALAAAWKRLQRELDESRRRLTARRKDPRRSQYLGGTRGRSWHAHGSGLDAYPAPAGSFTVSLSGERILEGIFPAGVYSHLLSAKHSAVLTSPAFDVDMNRIWIRVAGDGEARARYSMQHYPRVAGPIYKSHTLKGAPALRWLNWDMRYWKGDRAYLEIATAADIPVEARGRERSWWGITEVVFERDGDPPPRDEPWEFSGALFARSPRAPRSLEELARRYGETLAEAVRRWREDRLDDLGARFLDRLLRSGILPATVEEVPAARPLLEEYRRLEAEIPVPIRAPGLLPGDRIEQPLFVRGNHKQPGDPVPQRFLECLDATPYPPDVPGRLAWARDLLREDNPLPPRVFANRIWQWVFGRGISGTPDNLGHLGGKPSHPELLDRLAADLRAGGWSLKRTVRRLVLTAAFRRTAEPPPNAAAVDPDRRLLSAFPVRRLEAEAVRDAILAVSGRLDARMFGPSVSETTPRRSVYVSVRRNALSPFLSAFDAPIPFTTTGRRTVTNVPAQALTLMNDRIVIDSARAWAERILRDPGLAGDEVRIERMFLEALGRKPSAPERASALRYLAETGSAAAAFRKRRETLRERIASVRGELEALREEGRVRALARRAREARPAPAAQGPRPLARWEFEDGLEDALGNLDGEAVGAARVEGGRLLLEGGYVATKPLVKPLREKTLMVEVSLSGLDQRGVGAMTVQTPDGAVFDAIVYAEREPRRWMAGSDHFRRTQDVGGAPEAETDLVHLAITYAADGTIALYRNGERYGSPYKSSGPVRFEAGRAQILFGMRHGTPAERRGVLRGAIERAQLFDRALTAEEVAACARGAVDFVSREEIENALEDTERERMRKLAEELAALEAEAARLDAEWRSGEAPDPWSDLAHALFQLKEFIYLR